MNCLYEAVASVYLRVRGRFVPVLKDDLGDAEENLESCRASLASKERDLTLQSSALGRAALAKRKAGDIAGARFHLQVEQHLPRRVLLALFVLAPFLS